MNCRRSAHRRLLGFALVIALFPSFVFAQRGQDAGVVGTVRDSTGAVLQNATITVSSPQLIGSAQIAMTDANGMYRFPLLPPGIYDVRAERTGFKKTVNNVTLLPGSTVTIDLELAIADVTNRVVVEAAQSIIDVRTSASSTLIGRALLENLPLARDITGLVNLAPGVMNDVAFGGTALSNPFSMDGTSGNEPGWGTQIVTPSLNWIEEIQIVGMGAAAQYGEFSGAQVNAITRSGSNRFSGLADYLTTHSNWTGNNRGGLATSALREQFRPIEILQRWDANVQMGGPIAKDKLWFFTGGEIYRDVNRPVDFANVPRTAEEPKYALRDRKYIAKITAAVAHHVRAEGYIATTDSNTTGVNAGPLVRPEALGVNERGDTMWNARVIWTAGPRLFFDVRQGGSRASHYNGPQRDRRSGPAGHVDDFTGIQSANYPHHSTNLYQPISTTAALTFLPGGAQAHEFRLGFEYQHDTLFSQSGFVGGQFFQDFAGAPNLVILQRDAVYRPTQSRKTVYVQDSWSPITRFTVNAGLRAGFYSGAVPTRDDAFSATTISPRLGVAWSPTANHRTVVRAHYGLFHDQLVTSFYDFLDPLSDAPTITAQVVGPDQFVEIRRSFSSLNATIDPAIRFPFVREALVGIESQMFWGVAAKAQVIRRDFKEAIGFVAPESAWEPVERRDPGPDGRLATADDGNLLTVFLNPNTAGTVLHLTNPPDAYRRYRAAQFIATKRYSHDLDFQASYTWSRTVGSYNNAFTSNAANGDLGPSGNFVNPNKRLNTEGRTPQDVTHEIKVLGTYHLTTWGGFNVSGVYRYQSGRTWARSARIASTNIFVEPRATRQMAAVNKLDLRIEKTWRPDRRMGTLGLFADVFNVTNQGIALQVINQSGPSLGLPVRWSEPRVLRAGARLIF